MDPAQKDTGRHRVSDIYRVGVTDSLSSDWRKAALAPGARTRWLLEHAAAGLGIEPPAAPKVSAPRHRRDGGVSSHADGQSYFMPVSATTLDQRCASLRMNAANSSGVSVAG